MKGPPLGPGGEDITWPDQVAPRGRKASRTRKIKPQTSNFCSLTLLNNILLLQRQCLRTQLVIANPKGNTTVCPIGLLVPITRLVQFRPLCQDVVRLILHSVDPNEETVVGDTKRVHARSMAAILHTRSG